MRKYNISSKIMDNTIINDMKSLSILLIKTTKNNIILPGSIFSIYINTFLLFPVCYFLWTSIYDISNGIGGFTRSSLLVYVLIARLISSLSPNIGIGASLKTGDISFKLLRPVSYIKICKATAFGNTLAQLLIGIIPTIIVTLCVFKLTDINIYQLFYFTISLLLSFYMIIMSTLVVDLLTFWTINDWGLLIIYTGIYNILSGAVIPLDVFPEAISRIIKLLPFASTINSPLMLILHNSNFNDFLKTIVIQIVWLAIFKLIANLLWEKAINRLTIFGG